MCIRLSGILVVALVGLSSTTSTWAQSYKPLAENIGALAVAKRWCEDYQVDLESGVQLAVEQGINPLKGKFNELVEDTKTKLELALANLGVQKFCSITYERYKPGGPVPGFMVRK